MTVKLSIRKSGWYEFIQPLRDCEEFTTSGHLRGIAFRGPDSVGKLELGRLRAGLVADILIMSKCGKLEYIVYSYLTPIAWKANGNWYMNEDKYSVTTSKHQSKIAVALSKIDDPAY